MHPGTQPPPQWQPPPGVPQYPQWPSPPPYPNRPHPPFLSRFGKPAKLLLGIVSLWPVVYLVAFTVFFSIQFFSVFSRQLSSPQPADTVATFHLFQTFFLLQLFSLLVIIALTALYIIDVFRNDRVEQDRKVLWVVVLFMGGMVAMPAYWYLFVWREPERLQVSHYPISPYR